MSQSSLGTVTHYTGNAWLSMSAHVKNKKGNVKSNDKNYKY